MYIHTNVANKYQPECLHFKALAPKNDVVYVPNNHAYNQEREENKMYAWKVCVYTAK